MTCTACEFHQTSHVLNNFGGAGPTPAEVLFVGQAPGAAEEVHRFPLAGETGFLFNDLLKHTGLVRQQVRVTNAIRCRPPEKKDPTAKHIKACRPWLEQEILQTQPKVIVVMGRIALQSVMELTSITDVRGRQFTITKVGDTEIPPTIVFCMNMPAVAFRRWEEFPTIVEDFKKLGRLLSGSIEESPPGNYQVLRTVSAVKNAFEYLKQQPRVFFDLETTTFDFWDFSLAGWTNILCHSFSAYKGTAFILPFMGQNCSLVWDHVTGEDPERDFDEVWKLVCEFYASKTKKWAQNGAFDINFLRANKIPFDLDTFEFDPMTAHSTLQENMPHGLNFLIGTYTKMPLYDIKMSHGKVKNSYAEYPNDALWEYAGADSDAGIQVGDTLKHLLETEFTERFMNGVPETISMKQFYDELVVPLNHAVIEMRYRGIILDSDYLDKLQAEEEIVRARHLADFSKQLETVRGSGKGDINLRSTLELPAALFNPPTPPQDPSWNGNGCTGKPYKPGFGLPILKKTPGGKPSTDAEVIKALIVQTGHPAVTTLGKIRKCDKKISTYLGGKDGKSGMVKYMVPTTKRVHPDWKQHTVVTGRLAVATPAIHNIPSREKNPEHAVLRLLFTVPENWWMIQADYSQLELRVVAVLAQEPTMLQAFAEGKDIHKATASEIYGVSYDQVEPLQRKVAKDINFGIIYGKGEYSLAEDLGMTLEEAQSFLALYFGRYKRLRSFIDKTIEQVRKTGVVINNFGRKRRLYGYQFLNEVSMRRYSGGNDNFLRKTRAARAEMERQAVNMKVQSAGHDLMSKYGTAAIYQEYKRRNMKSGLIIEHHDALYAETPEEELYEAALILANCMEQPCPELNGVSFPVDLKIGRRWDEIDEPLTEKVNEYIRSSRSK